MPVTLQPHPRRRVIEKVLAQAWGGGDGILRGIDNEGLVEEHAAGADLTVDVETFTGFVSQRIIELGALFRTAAITAPTGGAPTDDRRIDRVQFTLGGGVNIVTGNDQASPVAPALSANSISLAFINCRNGMTKIYDTDIDPAEGHLTDDRSFV